MHLKRWITALVLLPVLFGILLKGSPLVFFFLVCLITVVSMYEYFVIISGGRPKPIGWNVTIPGYAASLIILYAAHLGSASMMLSAVALNIGVLSLIMIMVFAPDSPILSDIARQIQGVVYIPVFLSFLLLIRQSENGGVWIVWLWLIIAASDTGAYYCGTYYGKHPLAPRVSPKKTVEGAVGGLALAVVVGVVFRLLFISGPPLAMTVLFAASAAAVGQVGDLFESALKRQGGIKDSGRILPGHGGLLDRIDGLIFAVPVAYLFKVYLL